MKTYHIQYTIGGSYTCSYKVGASSRRVALKRFCASMQHAPTAPSGERMWAPTITFARKNVNLQLAA
jgi:hypothetical protein